MLGDLRHAVRSFRKTPGLTAIVLITLALGIGANTAIFSVIDAVLLRPTPLQHLDRLAMVWETDRNTGTTREPASLPDYIDFKARSRTFEDLAAVMAGEVNLTPERGDPVRLPILSITAKALPVLGLQPVAGRTFTLDEDRPGGPSVVLISEQLWERSFDRRPDVAGQTLRLDDRPYEVVGVLPAGADFECCRFCRRRIARVRRSGHEKRRRHLDADARDVRQLPRSTHPLFVIGRLSPQSTHEAAQGELVSITADLERAYPENAARGANVEPLDAVVFGPVRPALFILLAAVGLVLLVACVNVANLLLARASARAQDAAVRCALGASTARLVRQALAETMMLTMAAAVLGVGLAYGGVRALVAMAPADVPRLSLATINIPVLLTALTLAVFIGIAAAAVTGLLGLLPGSSHGQPPPSAMPPGRYYAATWRAWPSPLCSYRVRRC
jgi:predicted permease